MASAVPDMLLEVEYTEYARDYLRRLPLEHVMEVNLQGIQRAIVLACLALLRGVRPDVHFFNELLVQYERPRRCRPGQVVPDNMVVLHAGPLHVDLSYDVPLQPALPFWVMEWVSQRSKGKDYKDSFKKYERELKVPYCLMFWPQKQDLRLYHHDRQRYVRLEANTQGRYTVPELDLEVGLLERWVRFWHQGRLLPLPQELQAKLAEAEQRANEEQGRAEKERERAAQERERAEQERERAEQEKQRADALERQLEAEREARLAAERELEKTRGSKSPR